MQGNGNSNNRGIIPRSIETITSRVKYLQNEHGWKYSLNISIIEVYNEKIKGHILSL